MIKLSSGCYGLVEEITYHIGLNPQPFLHLYIYKSPVFVYHLELPENNPPLIFTDSDLEIQPQEGELIFFPSWLKHEVPENLTGGNRICIAGNMYYNEQTI